MNQAQDFGQSLGNIRGPWNLRSINFTENHLCNSNSITESSVIWASPREIYKARQKSKHVSLFSQRNSSHMSHTEDSQFIGTSRAGLVLPLLDSNNPVQNDKNFCETKSPLLAQGSHLPIIIPWGIHQMHVLYTRHLALMWALVKHSTLIKTVSMQNVNLWFIWNLTPGYLLTGLMVK